MKKFLVFLLILLVAVQSFSKWMILLEYQVNQEYIAKVLCENRELPLLKCKGKCQLMKKMETEEQSSGRQQNNGAQLQFAEALFDTGNGIITPPVLPPTQEQPSAHYLIKKYSAPAVAVFHPPLPA